MSDIITDKDRNRLRALACRQAEFAASGANEEILKKWRALGEGRRETPTVRLLFSNFTDEVIYTRLECEGKEARDIEEALLSTMAGRELFDDDTPISPLLIFSFRPLCLPSEQRPRSPAPTGARVFISIR